MGTKFAVVGNNSFVACEEIKMFALLSQLDPHDFFDFFIHNYLDNFDIEPFYNMTNNLDPDLKFIFENSSKSFFF